MRNRTHRSARLVTATTVVLVLALQSLSAFATHTGYNCLVAEPGWSEHSCMAHLSYADITWHFSGASSDAAKASIRKGSYEWESGHAVNLIEDGTSPNHVIVASSVASPYVVYSQWYDSAANHIDGFTMYFPTGYNENSTLSHGSFGARDLWSAASHEWGHVIGLGHHTVTFSHNAASSSVTGNPPSMCTGDVCGLNGHTERRDISSEDKAGRCRIYDNAHGYAC